MNVILRSGTKSLIYLLACALNKKRPDMNKIKKGDPEKLPEAYDRIHGCYCPGNSL